MIVLDKVTKYYGSHPAVHDLSFKIEEGECIGFLGLNGAGKTTTLRMLSCLLLPTSGTVTVKGFDAEEQAHEIRKLVGFLPDRPPVYPEMTVTAYLVFAGKLRSMDRAAVDRRLPKVLEDCGLGHVADEPIQNLSHGYQQRVGIAQAIIHDPALLILDEPIQGLDPIQIVEMRNMIRGLRGKHTILLSTHILSEIAQTSDRILMLHEGRVTAQGSEDELAARFGADGRARIDLELRVTESADASDSAKKALAALDGVDEVDFGSADAGVVRVTLRVRGDVREAVARCVVKGGIGLLRMEQKESGLEDIFVQLSKQAESAQEAEA
ncbi:MAG: ABC transporter ATP-binding protein [Deltaproteobacteria bacterium]|nr:ABC transporter ATP-binding protein [Deltaproteobacteria bacterium]